MEPHTVRPRRFDQAQEVADHFKSGTPVIMNLEGTERDIARRLIDFGSGHLLRTRRARWRRSPPACTCSSRPRARRATTTTTTERDDRRTTHGDQPAASPRRRSSTRSSAAGSTPTRCASSSPTWRPNSNVHRTSPLQWRPGLAPRWPGCRNSRNRGPAPSRSPRASRVMLLPRSGVLLERPLLSRCPRRSTKPRPSVARCCSPSARLTRPSPKHRPRPSDSAVPTSEDAATTLEATRETERPTRRGGPRATHARRESPRRTSSRPRSIHSRPGRDFLESDVDHLERHLVDERSPPREAATSLLDLTEKVPGGLGEVRRPLMSASDDATLDFGADGRGRALAPTDEGVDNGADDGDRTGHPHRYRRRRARHRSIASRGAVPRRRPATRLPEARGGDSRALGAHGSVPGRRSISATPEPTATTSSSSTTAHRSRTVSRTTATC